MTNDTQRALHCLMLFMVIEHFGRGGIDRVAERFRREGRMLPEGFTYQASWLEVEGTRCYQVIEAPSEERLSEWVSRWDDLVDFEIVSVLTSAEFWAQRNPAQQSPESR